MPRILTFLVPFIPSGYRTAAGVIMLAVGTLLAALSSPDVFNVLPADWAGYASLMQGWGATVAGLGIRFKGQS